MFIYSIVYVLFCFVLQESGKEKLHRLRSACITLYVQIYTCNINQKQADGMMYISNYFPCRVPIILNREIIWDMPNKK